MSAPILPLSGDHVGPGSEVGGKARALAELVRLGCTVPRGVVVTMEAYRSFLAVDALRERVALELHRKPLEAMRWEELWDAALRISHLFERTPVAP